MLTGESILCFAPDPWDDIWRNRHQIMSLLAAENQVLYVEPRPSLRPTLRQLRKGRLTLADFWSPTLSHAMPGLDVFHPPLYAPLSGRVPLSTLTNALRAASLRRAMRRLHMRQPILWLFRPDMADVPGRYGERLLIYHIVDEYMGYADVSAQRAEEIRRRERDLIGKADLVLVTSQKLLEEKARFGHNVHWVPNAVDYERFANATAHRDEPVELRGLPHPRIGYVGAINDKLDIDLLCQVAETYAEASIVLVGPERLRAVELCRGMETLRANSNVRLIGRVPMERVPHFVASCDVGLLPYLRNAWTESIHPLKMYEYLACGLPVVSTDIPGVHAERDIIAIAGDADAFVSGIAQVLLEDSEPLRRERQVRASHNTWKHRVERISELIEATRQKKRVH